MTEIEVKLTLESLANACKVEVNKASKFLIQAISAKYIKAVGKRFSDLVLGVKNDNFTLLEQQIFDLAEEGETVNEILQLFFEKHAGGKIIEEKKKCLNCQCIKKIFLGQPI